MINVPINGLGRVGRLLIRQMNSNPLKGIRIVSANDLVDLDNLLYLLKYDSVHGPLKESISIQNSILETGNQRIQLFSEKDPRQLPWDDLEVDVVLECTGQFRNAEKAARHLQAGAVKVIISAPSESADFSLVLGVNNEAYDPKIHHIISITSCTTNSLVPPLKVLLDNFGIESVLATTIHAYTVSQGTVDQASKTKNSRSRGGHQHHPL